MDYSDFLPDLNKAAERYREKVQVLLKYCVTCQPYDGGDYVWIHGEKTTVDEIMDSVNCPEKYRDDIAEHLHCPNCGSSSIERYGTVGTEDRYRIAEEERYNRILKQYADKIEGFRKHIEDYPSLALDHPMGRKIYKEVVQRRAESVTVTPSKWSRARVVDRPDVFDSKDLHAPGIGLSSGGRFHHPGQSVLYIADSEKLAMVETLDNPNDSKLIWIQSYSQTDSINDILDLRHDWDNIGQSNSDVMYALLVSRCIFEKVLDRNSKWRPQYFITTFIADCARKAGFKGIIYSSSRESYGYNLVLFDAYEPSIVPDGRPKVYIYEPISKNVYDPDDPTSVF